MKLDDYYKEILHPMVNKYQEQWGIEERKETMNSDDRLECLRLAVEATRSTQHTIEQVVEIAKFFYHWIYEQEKVNSLTFEKIHNERTEK